MKIYEMSFRLLPSLKYVYREQLLARTGRMGEHHIPEHILEVNPKRGQNVNRLRKRWTEANIPQE
jgi:hypothetical protein